MSLLEKLQESGIVAKDAVRQALRQAGSESEALSLFLEKGILSPETLAKARASLYHLPFISLAQGFSIPEDLLALFSPDAILQLKIIPLKRAGDEVEVGIVEPENIKVHSALDFIAVSYKISLKRFVISVRDFENVVKKLSPLGQEVKEAIEKLGEEREIRVEGVRDVLPSEASLQRLAEAAPVTRIVDAILEHGVEGEASDIHIEANGAQVRVRYRLDGKLKSSLFLPKDILPALISRVKILARLRMDETRVPQDGRIHLRFGSRTIDFRVSTFPTIEGEKVALRILDPSKGLLSLDGLGLQFKNKENVQLFMKLPFGAMLVSGPTGSGKSTTLYSILNQLNNEEQNIVTLEDPVEYYIPGINQSQVYPEIDYDFASGLRQVVRQDPNIIMVGEVRDNETAGLLIHSSLTGHLVFSTIHTNDAVGIIPRLLDMGIENFLIPSALKLIVAQRLIAKLCQSCKERHTLSPRVYQMLEKEVGFLPDEVLQSLGLEKERLQDAVFFKGRGCDNCGGQGTRGRIAIFESITMNPELERIIIEAPTESNLKKEAARQGMITMRQDGVIKAIGGIVGIEEVLANTEESYV
ncbi:MAG: type II/IV secretion system protein [Candidatus Portnoybacteria bacterium]|nr:type II/IV secretion system protein [Candidatus Portnoybacteria bacterium]